MLCPKSDSSTVRTGCSPSMISVSCKALSSPTSRSQSTPCRIITSSRTNATVFDVVPGNQGPVFGFCFCHHAQLLHFLSLTSACSRYYASHRIAGFESFCHKCHMADYCHSGKSPSCTRLSCGYCPSCMRLSSGYYGEWAIKDITGSKSYQSLPGQAAC